MSALWLCCLVLSGSLAPPVVPEGLSHLSAPSGTAVPLLTFLCLQHTWLWLLCPFPSSLLSLRPRLLAALRHAAVRVCLRQWQRCFYWLLLLCSSFGDLLSFTLTAFVELMDHGIVSWDTFSVAFIKKVPVCSQTVYNIVNRFNCFF